ncbi:MAG: phage tail family protein, partial [Actinobacteria bacterium]|nr:phage tail family protein [Actinomycetota bacterium]
MILQELSVTNAQGAVLGFPLGDISGGFVVKEIEGLGPVKATLVSSSFANMDGQQYHSSRREARNINIKLGLDPDYALYSVSDLRTQLYNFLMPKTQVKLKFRLFDKFAESVLDRYLELEIKARVETNEPDIFAKDPTVDLSLMCYDPDFLDPELVTYVGSTVDTLAETTIEYPGTVETGVEFTIFPDRDMDDFTIYHRPPDETLRTVYFTFSLLNGDELKISSMMGDKFVTLKRGGVESSYLFAISPQ